MKPIQFKEQTKVLTKPMGMTNKECSSLPVYSDGEICVSCWKMNLGERLKALLWGKVWLYVLSGKTQPPVSLKCVRTVFPKKTKR